MKQAVHTSTPTCAHTCTYDPVPHSGPHGHWRLTQPHLRTHTMHALPIRSHSHTCSRALTVYPPCANAHTCSHALTISAVAHVFRTWCAHTCSHVHNLLSTAPHTHALTTVTHSPTRVLTCIRASSSHPRMHDAPSRSTVPRYTHALNSHTNVLAGMGHNRHWRDEGAMVPDTRRPPPPRSGTRRMLLGTIVALALALPSRSSKTSPAFQRSRPAASRRPGGTPGNPCFWRLPPFLNHQGLGVHPRLLVQQARERRANCDLGSGVVLRRGPGRHRSSAVSTTSSAHGVPAPGTPPAAPGPAVMVRPGPCGCGWAQAPRTGRRTRQQAGWLHRQLAGGRAGVQRLSQQVGPWL